MLKTNQSFVHKPFLFHSPPPPVPPRPREWAALRTIHRRAADREIPPNPFPRQTRPTVFHAFDNSSSSSSFIIQVLLKENIPGARRANAEPRSSKCALFVVKTSDRPRGWGRASIALPRPLGWVGSRRRRPRVVACLGVRCAAIRDLTPVISFFGAVAFLGAWDGVGEDMLY